MPPSFVFVIMKSALQCGWDPLFQFPFCMKMAQRMIRLFKHSAPTALFTQWSILYQKSTITLGCVIRQTYSNFVDFCVVSGGLASRQYHYHFVSTAHFWSKKRAYCYEKCYGWLRTTINISNIAGRKLLELDICCCRGDIWLRKQGASCCHICHKTA